MPALHDPTVLRAIAHPLRNRILAELQASGPLRAADVARVLDVPANQASFHLRQLAKYGLVEEDPDAARDKRDRVWRVAALEGFDIDLTALEKEPGGAAAVSVFRRNSAAWLHHVVDHAYLPRQGEERIHRSVSEQALRLTADEARELMSEVAALVDGWSRRSRDAEPHPDRRTYLSLTVVQPYPDAGPDAGPGKGEQA